MKPSPAATAAAPIHDRHHFACRCRDAGVRRRFCEELLGLPRWHIIQSDRPVVAERARRAAAKSGG